MPLPIWRSRTVWTFLALTCLGKAEISIIGATYVTFLLSRGLDIFQATMVNFVFFATMLVFEVPTGALADMMGRKRSYVCSCVLVAIGLLMYPFATSVHGFMLAEAVIGFGATLSTGAFEAWLVDRLHLEGYRDTEIRKVFSWSSSLGFATVFLTALAGGWLAKHDLALPFLVGGGLVLVTTAVALLCMRDVPVRQRSIKQGLLLLRIGVRFAARHRTVRFLMLLGLVQTIATQAPNMLWQDFFLPQLGGRVEALGWLKAAIAVALLLGSLAAGRLGREACHRRALGGCQLVVGVGVLGTVLCPGLDWRLAAFLIHEAGRGMFEPLRQGCINSCVRSKHTRATVLSCEALGRDVGCMIGLPLAGLLGREGSGSGAWVLSGILVIAGTLLVARLARR